MIPMNEITMHFVRGCYYYLTGNSIYHIHKSRAIKSYQDHMLAGTLQTLSTLSTIELVKDGGQDLLDELIAERTARNSKFPQLVKEAEDDRSIPDRYSEYHNPYSSNYLLK
jgi:hypothetical protein